MKKKSSIKKPIKYQFAGPKSTTDYTVGYNPIGVSANTAISEEEIAAEEAKLGRALTEVEKAQLAAKRAQASAKEQQSATTEGIIGKGQDALMAGAAADATEGNLGNFFKNKGNVQIGEEGDTKELSGLAIAGIGVGGKLIGSAIENKADDDNPYTATEKEGKGNVAGRMFKSGADGFLTGATAGSFIPGVGNLIGGAVGAAVGAGIGLATAKKENKEAEKEAERLQEEKDRIAGDYNSAFIRSRQSGPQPGFGYGSSTNTNMQSTNSFYAALGGAKPLPGGYEVPIGPNGEVKYIGNTHKQGGILESPTTEVENNETKDMVLMKKGGDTQPKEYFFSEYLKLGGKSFAKIHESMVKKGASQKQIQDLAEKQEKVAGRNPKQIAAYGGVRKYQVAGEKETDTFVGPTARTQEELQVAIQAERDRKMEEAANNVTPASYAQPQTTAVPQMAYDVNKPLLGKESMTEKEYDAAVAKYGLGTVDPLQATFNAYDKYAQANKNTITLAEDEDNLNNLFSTDSSLGSKNLNVVEDKDYNILGYETKEKEAAGQAQATVYNEAAKTAGALPSSKIGSTSENPEYWSSNESYDKNWKPLVASSLGTDEQVTNIATALRGLGLDSKTQKEVNRRIDAAGGDVGKLRTILQEEATDRQIGPFHRAMWAAIQKQTPPKEPEKPAAKTETPATETPAKLEEKFQACPPGQYRNENGVCVAIPKGDIKEGINKSLLFGALQMVPAGYAMLNPYKTAAPIATGPAPASVKGAVLPRVNMNQERAAGIQMARGMQTAIQNQNAGPGGIAAMMATNSKLSDQMLQIASQEQRANLQLAAEEARLGQQASQFNVEAGLKSDAMRADIAQFNKKLEVGEKQYKREERLGTLDAAVRGATGVYRDQLQYKAQDRLARAINETGSYDRFDFIEKALKDRKKKDSPYYGMSEYDINQIAAERFPVNVVVEAPKKPKESKEADNKKKGGVKRYVSRLGQLNYNKTKI